VAKPNLSNYETQELEETIAKYEDVLATENRNYGQPDRHTTNSAGAFQISCGSIIRS
jgi:hypothetical protein